MTDPEEQPDCFACPGWGIFNAGPSGLGGDIERCDNCAQLPDDNAAVAKARTAGLILDGWVVEGRTDANALDAITEAMSGTEWNADTLDLVANLVRCTGRIITEPGENHG